jgi:hypothetical protein
MTEFGLRATIEGSPEYFQTRAANDNAAWVADVFQDTLGRAPLANESLFWIGTLNQQVSRSQVAQSIGASAEGLQSWVGGVFEDYLNRAPDPGGLATYTSFLQQGGTPLNARATILGSGEFYGLQARTELQEAVVPEPQAYAMVAGLGLTGLVVWRRRQAARA